MLLFLVFVLPAYFSRDQSRLSWVSPGLARKTWVQAGCPFCHPTKSVKAMKKRQEEGLTQNLTRSNISSSSRSSSSHRGSSCFHSIVWKCMPHTNVVFYCVCAVLFAVLGFVSVVPVVHSVFIDDILSIVNVPAWLPFMAALYLVGGVMYAVRFPECLLPGTFDIWVPKL